MKRESKGIKVSLFGKLFGELKGVALTSKDIKLIFRHEKSIAIGYSEFIDLPTIGAGWFGKRLTLTTANQSHQLRFLKLSASGEAYAMIKRMVVDHRVKVIGVAAQEYKKRAIDEFLRDSSIELLEKCISPILTGYRTSKGEWEKSFRPAVINFLSVLDDIFPLSNGKEKLRANFEIEKLKSRKSFYDRIESNPLTEQQRLAVIRSNDRNLILAAAGTGKTSVMVAKALDLIDSCEVDKSEILILAYNKAAANELKERVLHRGGEVGVTGDSCPTISTFHALGLSVLREAKISTYLSAFCDDPIKLEMWVTDWLVSYIKSSPGALNNFIGLLYQPINPFDFKTKEEYDNYVRDNEYRTLNGERVRGYQELLISNWLFMNGVEYEYEAPYVTQRRVEVGFNYKPDFHIKNAAGPLIYLEHFGVDRSGNTRPDIDREKYQHEMGLKRNLHSECETVLIETYHFDWVEGKLEERLEILMHEHNVELKKKTPQEMFESLNKSGCIDEGAKRYLKCLQAMRVERLDKALTFERLTSNKIVQADKYSELLDALQNDYMNELMNQDRIDFDDMILRSSTAIESGYFKPKWKQILVDEFQDISMSRMELLRAIVDNGPSPILTVVGDDWQSIYRFSGGKLELTTRFEELIGSCSLTKLEKTFRYNNSIADTAGTFIMKNPEQYEKHVETQAQVSQPHVHLLDSNVEGKNKLEERVVQVVKKISANDPGGSIAILARYRYLINAAKTAIRSEISDKNIKYWTFHGSKGLEADYCILIGFFQGKHGFPNMNKEEAVVESLLPSLDSFPHSEERRLFYVALTRAKNKSYLIADPMGPSEFIIEMLAPKYKLNIASKTFEKKYRAIFKCHVCNDGHFRLITGKFGPFYSCSSGSVCRSKPRICDKCGAPSIDGAKKSVCNNTDCKNEKSICDVCGRPMKLREGRFGQFWGCSGYGIKDDQCKHTRKYFGI